MSSKPNKKQQRQTAHAERLRFYKELKQQRDAERALALAKDAQLLRDALDDSEVTDNVFQTTPPTMAHQNVRGIPALEVAGPALPVANVDRNLAAPINGNRRVVLQHALANIVAADLHAAAQFGGDYGFKLGMSILRVIYVYIHKIRSGDQVTCDEVRGRTDTGDFQKFSHHLVNYVPIENTQTPLTFANFLIKILNDDDIMGYMFNKRNEAHTDLVTALIGRNIMAAGATRTDLTTVKGNIVSAMGKEDVANVQICCVFKCLKLYSYLLQDDPSQEIIDRMESNMRASNLVSGYVDGSISTLITAHIQLPLLLALFANNLGKINVIYP